MIKVPFVPTKTRFINIYDQRETVDMTDLYHVTYNNHTKRYYRNCNFCLAQSKGLGVKTKDEAVRASLIHYNTCHKYANNDKVPDAWSLPYEELFKENE